jgi:nitroreductase
VIHALEEIWRARSSSRAFLPDPIDPATLEQVFALGQTAPSWCNVQPWRVVVTTPPKTAAIATALQAAAKAGMIRPEIAFPLDYPAPYKQRRIECGAALYTAMGIARDDKASRYDAWLRNYALFDAPHVAIVACDRRLGPYAYLDVGVWLGYVLTAAAALGVDTCPMASVAAYPDTLRTHLPIGEHEIILFGMVFGHADVTSPTNRARTTREPLATNVTFVA